MPILVINIVCISNVKNIDLIYFLDTCSVCHEKMSNKPHENLLCIYWRLLYNSFE